jgi:heterodisulfide reductase subunit A-like polyferredoxin
MLLHGFGPPLELCAPPVLFQVVAQAVSVNNGSERHLHGAERPNTLARDDVLYDAVVIGSGIGGLTAATHLVAKGAKVAVLEK